MNYFEFNESLEPDGRRRFRASLHEIYPDETYHNLNGICYLREYTERNMDSAIGMPICCEFNDEDKRTPLSHGFTGRRERDGLALFTNSVVVGTVDRVSIEEIQVNGQTETVLMSYGVIYEQRYPEFVSWVKDRLAANMAVQGSVEFVGTKENDGYIKYLNDFDGEGRIPTEYLYSGYCVLSVPPSDGAALLLELNQRKEGGMQMDEQFKSDIRNIVSQAFKEINSENAERDAEIESYKGQIAERDVTINELNEQIAQLNQQLADKDEELNACRKRENEQAEASNLIKNELDQIKCNALKCQLNQKLSDFSDEQRKVAESEINSFMEDPINHAGEIDAIADKIAAAVYREQLKRDGCKTETNSWLLGDIFSGVDPVKDADNKPDKIDPYKDFI